jgi:hypothetical protein
MKPKNFSKSDLLIAENGEAFTENLLESIIGGKSDEAQPCSCDCWIGNSNNTTPIKKSTAKLEDVG